MSKLTIKAQMIISAIAATNGKTFSVVHKRVKPKVTKTPFEVGDSVLFVKTGRKSKDKAWDDCSYVEALEKLVGKEGKILRSAGKADFLVKFTDNPSFFIPAKFLEHTDSIKKAGTVEHFSSMTCRTDVKKHLKGGKSTIAAKKDEGLIGVYKMATPKQYKDLSESELKRVAGYRAFYAQDVKSITVQGVTTTFNDV